MSFKTDCGGFAVRADIKIAAGASTWNTRLSQIARHKGEIFLCTFSLSRDMEYISQIFDKRSHDITLIVNSKFRDRATMLKQMYPSIKILLAPDVHAKFALLSPHTVWLSSENFVKSSNFENTVGIHSREVYSFYMDEVRKFIDNTCIDEIIISPVTVTKKVKGKYNV